MSSVEMNPYSLPLLQYKKYLDEINGGYLAENRRALLPLEDFLLENDICAISVGSDGKKERHPQSKTEIMYLQDTNGLRRGVTDEEIVKRFQELTGRYYIDVFEPEINSAFPIKTNIDDGPLSFVAGNPRRIFPDRIINSQFVLGTLEAYQKAKKIVFEELGERDHLSLEIKRELKKQKHDHYKACLTGISRGKICFGNGEQFYDENEHPGRFGFKHAFIRFVQRDLDLRTQQKIIDKVWSIDKASNVPTNTVERISFFEYSHDMAEAYLWFLKQYHEVQDGYKTRRLSTVLPYDSYSYKECAEIILRGGSKL